jgi:hypothetical protein
MDTSPTGIFVIGRRIAVPGVLLAVFCHAAPSQAGCCFLWMDDGSRSTCDAAATTAERCEASRKRGTWSRRYFYEATKNGRCACEGDYAVCYEPDLDDLDADKDRKEMIRWKYVVSVPQSQMVKDRCREKQRLLRGWTDDEYS